MLLFSRHELEIIEVALIRYAEKLDESVFGERERERIKVILGKLDDIISEDEKDKTKHFK